MKGDKGKALAAFNGQAPVRIEGKVQVGQWPAVATTARRGLSPRMNSLISIIAVSWAGRWKMAMGAGEGPGGAASHGDSGPAAGP